MIFSRLISLTLIIIIVFECINVFIWFLVFSMKIGINVIRKLNIHQTTKNIRDIILSYDCQVNVLLDLYSINNRKLVVYIVCKLYIVYCM